MQHVCSDCGGVCDCSYEEQGFVACYGCSPCVMKWYLKQRENDKPTPNMNVNTELATPNSTE
jgi:hypothetical protein